MQRTIVVEPTITLSVPKFKEIVYKQQTKPTYMAWDSKYPSPEMLKAEVRAGIDAFTEILFKQYPATITGLYWKGSSEKNWDSAIDYVPGISDVDIHCRFAGPTPVFATDKSLEFSNAWNALYRAKMPNPVHTPDIQFAILNNLEQQEDYIPSPHVTVLFGEPYQTRAIPQDHSVQRARTQLLEKEQFVQALPERIMGKSPSVAAGYIRELSWRVSSAGPSMLCVLGELHERAWSMNRTQLVSALEQRGESVVASQYAAFYLHCWDYFLSGKKDDSAAAKAIVAGTDVLRASFSIAKRF